MDDDIVRLADHRPDHRAGEVEFEVHITCTRTMDGRLTTAFDWGDGSTPRSDAARYLQLAAIHMEEREAEVIFTLAMGRDPAPKDEAFPWRWESDFFALHTTDGADPELCGTDRTARVEILKRVVEDYAADQIDLQGLCIPASIFDEVDAGTGRVLGLVDTTNGDEHE